MSERTRLIDLADRAYKANAWCGPSLLESLEGISPAMAASHAMFRREIARFPEAKLGRKRPKVDATWSVLIYGQVEHCLYHAGQVALLRRALGKPLRG